MGMNRLEIREYVGMHCLGFFLLDHFDWFNYQGFDEAV